MVMGQDHLLTVAEVTARLELRSTSQVYRLIREGRLPAVQPGDDPDHALGRKPVYYVRRDDLERFRAGYEQKTRHELTVDQAALLLKKSPSTVVALQKRGRLPQRLTRRAVLALVDSPKFLGVSELARLLSLSRVTVYAYRKAGILPCEVTFDMVPQLRQHLADLARRRTSTESPA